ncbi:hypothetical protein ACISU4_20430 [Streptomyces wuyuanensis]|uniref:hypothetical protein n=1 Tax=Streptomyces wuyuanensis TaxID=1196353 RepID=UPI00381EC47E
MREAGLRGRTAGAAAPQLCRPASSRRIRQGTRLPEVCPKILRGRGAGTGWDLHGEIVAARRCLRGVDAQVVFDVGADYGQWSTGLRTALGRRTGRFFTANVCSRTFSRGFRDLAGGARRRMTPRARCRGDSAAHQVTGAEE